MATADILTDPAFYEQLKANQKHATFLSGQLQEARNEIQTALEMVTAKQLSSGDADIIRKLQTALVEKLKDLDEVTRTTQVLLGLPNVESDDIEVSQLEVDRLGANPTLLELSTYGILQRVPKAMVVGDRTVLISPDSPAMWATVEETKTSPRDSETKLGTKSSLMDPLKKLEKELQAKEKKLAQLENQLKGKHSQLARLIDKNRMMKEAMKVLNGDALTALERLPHSEEEADSYLQVLSGERQKIDKLSDKVQHEIQQQQRANYLLAKGRILPNKQTEDGDTLNTDAEPNRIYDPDTERSLNKELIAYEQAKQERERKAKELAKLKADNENLADENEELKNKLERMNQDVKDLIEVMGEIREAKELEEELSVVEKELDNAHEKVRKLNQEEEQVGELLHRQEYELSTYQDKFIKAQEKYEACGVVIAREEEEHRKRESLVKHDIDCFRTNMESKLNMYRALPFVLGVTFIQNMHAEELTLAVIQDNTLLERDITAHKDKVEAMLGQLKEHETRVKKYKAKEMKVVQLRNGYDETEHILNKHRQTIAALRSELDGENNKIEEATNEIEILRATIEELKKEYALKNFALQQENEKKKLAQMTELNNLELEIARKRGLMRAHRMILHHKEA